MIERIEFTNYKALRAAVLPLGQFTLIVGPNGSGKTTALKALESIRALGSFSHGRATTAGVSESERSKSIYCHANIATVGVTEDVGITIQWGEPDRDCITRVIWRAPSTFRFECVHSSGAPVNEDIHNRMNATVSRSRVYALDADRIAQDVRLVPNLELQSNGYGLAGVLDGLRDGAPERFEAMRRELPNWFPEYDNILFETPSEGMRNIALRARNGGKIPARDLSQGTLLALAMLTLAHLPDPPPVVGFEEPDRGIHPRLLREIQDALYRLSYPENAGETRAPVQVIATTHSPYFLDLFKDHPEEIVIAQKHGADATFERLSDRPDVDQILDGASLGDVWFSGILGGVPVAQ